MRIFVQAVGPWPTQRRVKSTHEKLLVAVIEDTVFINAHLLGLREEKSVRTTEQNWEGKITVTVIHLAAVVWMSDKVSAHSTGYIFAKFYDIDRRIVLTIDNRNDKEGDKYT